MAEDIVYQDLGVAVRKREGQGMYEFGVFLDGAFVVIGGRKTGGVDDDIARAQDEEAQRERDEQAAQVKAEADARAQAATQPVNPTPPAEPVTPQQPQQ